MGIKNLMSFLKKKGFVEREIPFAQLDGKSIAIDMDNLAVRFYSIAKKTVLDNTNLQVDLPDEKEIIEESVNCVSGHIRRLSRMCKLHLCFDGKANKLKAKAWKERGKSRFKGVEDIKNFEKISPFDRTQDDVKKYYKHFANTYNSKTIKTVLEEVRVYWDTQENVKCHIGSGDNQEAEAECVKLMKAGNCQLIYSMDTDLIAYGATNIIRNVSWSERKISVVKKSDILRVLNLNMKQLRDFCIMCGTDYNGNIKGVGPVGSLKLIQKYGCIDDIEGVDVACLNHKEVRPLFLV